MFKHHSWLSFIVYIICTMLFGVGLAYLFSGGVSFVLVKVTGLTANLITKASSSRMIIYESESSISQKTNLVKPRVLDYIEVDKIKIPILGKFVLANLSKKTITLYQAGQEVDVISIETIGKKGELWETPHGLYKIETKERNHFSSIGQVYMPYSMQFNGNYFIHGWTYYPNGTPVSAEFSGGCIKLKTLDAKEIYDFVEVGTPVYVYSNTDTSIKGHFVPKKDQILSNISASSFLVADVANGEILTSADREKILPSGPLSQVISALVALDAINFFNSTKVFPGQLKEFNSATLLLPGEKVVIKDLLYPILFGDNGVAANTLANIMGSKIFVAKMNNRAKSINLSQTTFFDPVGLSEENLSSVTDLFKLARHVYFFKNQLWDITQEIKKVSGWHIWQNKEGFIGLDGFLGGLSGQITNGKSMAMALFAIPTMGNSSRVVAVTVLDSDNAKADIALLANYARTGFSYESIKVSEIGETLVTTKTANFSTSTTLAFVGDIMLDREVKRMVQVSGAGDFNFPFADLKKIKDTDILFGNLEGPVSDLGKNVGSIYSFRMMPQVVPALQAQGFDVLSVANNHAGDWTSVAFVDTFTKFQNSNISLIGGGLSRAEAIEPKIIEKNGIKFGYLGFSDVGPDWLKTGTAIAGILLASDPKITEIIKQASTKCDVLIVSYHFGNEYEKESNWRQQQLARLAIDNGAKIVVGHHPHIPQEIENYRDGVIMYSLGNFIFDQNFSTSTMSGLAVKITFDGKNISKVEKYKTVLDKQYRVSVE